MADYLVTDTELTGVADAIRTKGGTSAALVWPSGYVDAIGAISGGETWHTIHGIMGQTMYASVTLDGTCYNDDVVGVKMGMAPTGATVTVELGYDYIFTESYGVTNLSTGELLPLVTRTTTGGATIYQYVMPDADVAMNPYYDD